MNLSARNWTMLRISLAVTMLFLTVCKFDLGQQPVGGSGDTNIQGGTTVVEFSVMAGRSQIRADGQDTTIITATIADSMGVLTTGDTINFRKISGPGLITSSAAVTLNGDARIGLKSQRENGVCTIVAWSKKYNVYDTCRVMLTGINLSLTPNISTAKVNDSILVTARVTNFSNVPQSGDTIAFLLPSAGVLAGNADTVRKVTSTTGQASVKVTSNTKGIVVVLVEFNGSRDSVALSFIDTTQAFSGTRKFSVYTSKTQLKADNSDTVTVTAELKDEFNTPAIGDTVLFSCSLIGIIGRFAVIDNNGRAQVTLRSQRENGECIITAIAPQFRDTVETKVTMVGVKVQLESDVMDSKINDPVTISAILTDASGNQFGGDSVTLTSKGGIFSNGTASTVLVFNANGRATVKFTSSTAGFATVYAKAKNSSDSLKIVFTNNALTLTTSDSNLTVGGTAFATLTATYVNGSNQPMAGVAITFSTNAGSISTATVTTNAAGQAKTNLFSANFAGTATVVASTSAGNAVIKINFVASLPKHIKLTLSPDNIGVNGGVATLTAIVTDTNGNMVTGSDVNFRIIKGPGGGEYIDKPLVTSQSGIAHAQLFAGSIPSQYRSCLISASVGTIADSSKLTISGEPYSISVSRPQSDTVTVSNTGQMNPATFDYNAGAVVVDINGNPVADGTQVNFSVVVSGMAAHQKYFIKWAGLGGTASEVVAVCGYGTRDVPFEDINNNFTMDENDLRLDYNDGIASRGDDVNGDGRCDFNPLVHDLWVDFNGNSKVDAGSTLTPIIRQIPITKSRIDTVYLDSIVKTSSSADSAVRIRHLVVGYDTTGYNPDTTGFNLIYTGAEPFISVGGVRVWADLYPNGVWDTTELVRDLGTPNVYDRPASNDRRWYELECYPFWFTSRFDFDKNDFGVAITSSATTLNGVADVHVTYPRQLARRLIVTVNAEANGVRDRTGERFTLPVIVGN